LTYRFTILGCSSSPGVPRIDGDWGACDPDNPRNRRLRCSLLVEREGPQGTTTVVIDTTPDFRTQMLAAGVKRLDGVVYTHAHADHIHGIDDLRGYALVQRKRVPVHGDHETMARLFQAFGYCFETPEGSYYPPILEAVTIGQGQAFEIDGPGGPITFLPIAQIHGNTSSLAFRIGGDIENREGGFCYSPDVSDLSERSQKDLRSLDFWVVDALQYREHVSHFSLEQALGWIEKLAPKRAVLTHMHIPLDYATVMAETPDHVEPAYDGMVLELPERR
jgi:phosphoribosyl 1,2-cyclic phosphate phosphodiesterase